MEWYEKLYTGGYSDRCVQRLWEIFAVILLCCLLTGEIIYGEDISAEVSAGRDTETYNRLTPEKTYDAGGTLRRTAAAETAAGVSAGAFSEVKLQEIAENTGKNPAAGKTDEDMQIKANPAVNVSAPAVPAREEKETQSAAQDTLQDVPPVIGVLPDSTPAEPEKFPEQSAVSVPQSPQYIVTDGFLIDNSGTVCGIADPGEAADGAFMSLPDEGCSAVSAEAFAAVPQGIREIYIPSNITHIDEGAFAGFSEAEWFTMEPSGGYMSVDGVLFSEDGACLLAFPAARTGIYKVPENVVRFARDAFAGASISKLDIRGCSLEEMQNLPEDIEIISSIPDL